MEDAMILCSTFKDNVKLFTYGDDNILGVSDDAAWFNHTTISFAYAAISIEYTMADKGVASIPYIDIKDATFLKRKWVYDKDVGAYLAPLEHDSINKMITVCVKSKNVCPEAQAISSISTAIREYFFYGKEIYNEKADMFREIIVMSGLQAYVGNNTIPEWEDLYTLFWDSSKHVKL